MAYNNLKESQGSCGYCFKGSFCLREVYFLEGNTWSKQIHKICAGCRKYLHGHFKYKK